MPPNQQNKLTFECVLIDSCEADSRFLAVAVLAASAVSWWADGRGRLASARGSACEDKAGGGAPRFRRLVLSTADALAGSAIDDAFAARPPTSDAHSLSSALAPADAAAAGGGSQRDCEMFGCVGS